jgi:hypothetical protein
VRKSAFNAEGLRLIIGAVKIYVAEVEALGKKERGDETQFTTKIAKIGGKFDALLCRNWLFSPPNRLTLQIILLPDM